MDHPVAEEVAHWKNLDRKRKHRSFALFTKMSPLIQVDSIMSSLQALSSAAQQELYVSGWNNGEDIPKIEEPREAPYHEAIPDDSPPGSWSFPEIRESPPGTSQDSNDFPQGSKIVHADHLSTEDPDLRQAMLGVAIIHLFLILGTVMLLAYLALYGPGGSPVSTFFAVVGIVVIVVATLKVNRYCLTAALYLMRSERRR